VQYEFERALGEGGMGAVILARDRALDRKVAIKVLHGGAGSSEDQRGRFRREPSSPHD
jgi:serine/threonine protein kinase